MFHIIAEDIFWNFGCQLWNCAFWQAAKDFPPVTVDDCDIKQIAGENSETVYWIIILWMHWNEPYSLRIRL